MGSGLRRLGGLHEGMREYEEHWREDLQGNERELHMLVWRIIVMFL